MGYLTSSFKGFFWNILGAGFGFLFQIVAAKVLGADIYGQANYFLGYTATITLFIGLGLQTYIPKMIHKCEDKKKLFSEVFYTYTTIFLIIQFIIGFILNSENISIKNIIIILLLSYLTTLSEIVLSFNVSLGNIAKGMFYRKFLYSVLNLVIFSISIIFLQKEYYLYLFVLIISYILTNVKFIIENVSAYKFNFNIVKSSISLYAIQIVYGFYAAYSKVLQKNFGTFESVAVLSISLTIGTLVAMLGDNFAKVSMVEFSKYWAKGDKENLRKTYTTVTRVNCFLVMPIAVILVINADKILDFLGKGYESGSIIFIFVMISQFINSFTGPNGTVLVMTKYSKFEIVNGIIKLIAAILLCYWLGKEYVWAVAFSLAGSEIIVNILKTVQVKIKLDMLPYRGKDILYVLCLFVVNLIILIGITKVQNIILWGLLNGIAVLIIYFISFRFSPNEEDKLMLDKIINTIKRRGK